MKSCSIIIMNHNGKTYLENCLDSIKDNTSYPAYNIIVVDNNSDDGSKELMKSKFPEIDLIKNPKNYGASETLNIGIKYAMKKYNPEYFYLLNNDTLVFSYWLSEAIKTVEGSKDIGIVGSKQLTFNLEPTTSAGWIKIFKTEYCFSNKDTEVEWTSGAGLLIKKEVIKKIGLFDEMYNPAYYEETDLEKRAILAGFKIVYCPESTFLHKGGAASKGKNVWSELIPTFYRNRARFFYTYSKIGFVVRLITDLYKSRKKIGIRELLEESFNGIKNSKKNKIEFPYG